MRLVIDLSGDFLGRSIDSAIDLVIDFPIDLVFICSWVCHMNFLLIWCACVQCLNLLLLCSNSKVLTAVVS